MNPQINVKDQTTINELYFLLTKANFSYEDLKSVTEKIYSLKTNLNLISNNGLSLMQAAVMSRSYDVIKILIQGNYVVKSTDVVFSEKYPNHKDIHDYLALTLATQSVAQIPSNRKPPKPPLL